MSLSSSSTLASVAQHAGHAVAFLAVSAPAPAPVPLVSVVEPVAVSATMRCAIFLAVQYFTVYTLACFVRTYYSFSGQQSKVVRLMPAVCNSVNFAPMLAALFLAGRMLSLQVSGGKLGDPAGLGVEAMELCCWALIGQTLTVILVGWLASENADDSSSSDEEDGAEVDESNGRLCGGASWILIGLTAVKHLCTLVLLSAAGVTAYAILTTPHDKALYPEGRPPMPPAIGATMNLAIQYFGVFTALAIARSYNEVNGTKRSQIYWENLLRICAYTVAFAPMVSVLFIAARLRALQIDPVNGHPQYWAQMCFYVVAYAILTQTCTVLLSPVAGVKPAVGLTEGDISFTHGESPAYRVMDGVRLLSMLAIYGGTFATIASVFLIEAPEGKTTPPIAPAMACVINLTIQFFAVYFLLWSVINYRQYFIDQSGVDAGSDLVSLTLDSARLTVQYAPMLSILFVGVRMRALAITDNRCGPQQFAQDAMYLATNQLMLQVFMVLCFPYLADNKVETDEDGNPKGSAVKNPTIGAVVEFVRYMSMLMMYACISTLCYSLFSINSENANCGGVENHTLSVLSFYGPSRWVIVLSFMSFAPLVMLLVARCSQCY